MKSSKDVSRVTETSKKKLTPQQRKFVKNLVRTGKTCKSSELAGYHRTYGSQLMAQPHIQTAIVLAMDKAGISDDKLAKKLKQGLNAYVPPKAVGGKKYPDFYSRFKYLDMAIKIKGGYAPEKHQIESKQIVLMITPEVIKGLKDTGKITEEEAKIVEGELIDEQEEK